ncbi:sensor histidine kinase [Acidisphaera rubrifaciens]|uniref:histidine kinase n=1 Tax=Acidisphaera rubrifaciens HS-AP3 TaxID=1231350 RepID=A0A0D6P8U1_9PROT|nr:sensor histidine kinase [Acidisphaera rubrifaciens]GAN77608.1 signal transduction histidine kinase [Acidisphaera rubrifaciens HS-AP3]
MSRTEGAAPVWDAERLRIATDAAGVALWAWRVETDEITMDARAERLWGVPTDGGVVSFTALSSRIHPADLDRVRAAFTSTRDIPGEFELDFRILDGQEVRWVAARGQGEDHAGAGQRMFGIFLDVTERKLAEEDRELLAGEMSHRVKNLFAIAAGLTQIAARSATTPEAMAADLTRRLYALGQAHELVRPTLLNERKATTLGALIAVLLGAYDDKGTIGDRIRVRVPELPVGEGSITTLALVVHELATNSLKYGALSAAAGRLSVACDADDDAATIVWTETGGPPVTAGRGEPGFGSTLVHRSIVRQLGGSIEFDWAPEGVVATLRVSKARLAV